MMDSTPRLMLKAVSKLVFVGVHKGDLVKTLLALLKGVSCPSSCRIQQTKLVMLLGRSPHKNCKNDLDDQT